MVATSAQTIDCDVNLNPWIKRADDTLIVAMNTKVTLESKTAILDADVTSTTAEFTAAEK